ncbi:MAG: hypothetical protein EA365_00380 [Gloeocapsa sp. DLM2.Bin57]|nr:MAG: hypothetical protein EA365_00380 [Gloeocapsa sp. DLM2.Bin57]
MADPDFWSKTVNHYGLSFCLKKGFIFVHIPKTGGTSICTALKYYNHRPINNYYLNKFLWKYIGWLAAPTSHLQLLSLMSNFHISARDIKSELESQKMISSFLAMPKIREQYKDVLDTSSMYDKLFKFAIVRNPWTRELSIYEYIKGNKKHPRHEFFSTFKSFNEFLNWKYENQFVKNRRPGLIQLDYITDANGNIIVDFFGKTENLAQDFQTVLNKLGITDVSLPHVNKSKSNDVDYKSYYDDEAKEIVGEMCKEDLEFFGYTFD